jgi:RHS repeat-associated protein
MNVVSQIASDDQYHYGFNGKYKDNEFAGVGNNVDYGERRLETRTGKWPTPDKMGGKYPGVSPYAFVRNSPIVKYDPDGNTDYTATVNTNKSGTIKAVKVDIQYAVINISHHDLYNTNIIAGSGYGVQTFSGSFVESVNGKVVTVNVSTDVSYRQVENINQVKNGENVMFVTDDIQPQTLKGVNEGSNPVGLGELGGDVMSVEYDWVSSDITMTHEMTHNFGAEFPNNKADFAHSLGDDYMNAHSATKRGKAGQMSPRVFKDIFKGTAHIKDGTSEMIHGDSKKNAVEYLNKTHQSYDHDKAKKAGVE